MALHSFKKQLRDKIPAKTRENILNLLDHMDAAERHQGLDMEGEDNTSSPFGTTNAEKSVTCEEAKQLPITFEDRPKIVDLNSDLHICGDFGQDACPGQDSSGSSVDELDDGIVTKKFENKVAIRDEIQAKSSTNII